ncbi:prepilin-type N-terminal cleavage/methylation domain-containing protein [Vibrio parahaemolyticus]|uniref:pilin n=4 Tax=Vibrio parahaemolyticus TaxID=670 RepID=UPI00084B3663|nr:pilin [Vibrio parahaemolyticus]EGQ8157305.1 pilin [Vibrio parahaemolyticus]EGQ8287745.1 prepilin-type N-terminal cleavage/methylation domain-containing protein [Vibrio parahaemolyticus]EGQ8328248.1 prepilin-type N-terminal cleavage/methylation domain-containing protein [Vibrio parahaemolyticus]EGQ8350598.1 prepilin-type N-terminal cleavage/methylation domain-containing protein [Vibrio parahaemolyticus]EGQ8404161.1 prepilin-type N-terminal cleavage/methylation domain-containing protein [Vibr
MKHSKQKKQQGFTLIELMIVVAIIGVLSAIAVPAYQNYVAKSEAATALGSLRALVTPAELKLQQDGELSGVVADLGGSASHALGAITTSGANISAATLTFTFNTGSLNGDAITLTKTSSGWTCTDGTTVLDNCN